MTDEQLYKYAINIMESWKDRCPEQFDETDDHLLELLYDRLGFLYIRR